MISEAISRLAIIQTERMAPPAAFLAAAKSILRQTFAEHASKPVLARRIAKPKSVRFAAAAKPPLTSGVLAEPDTPAVPLVADDDADDLVILPATKDEAKPFVPTVMTQPDIEADPTDQEGSSDAFNRALV